MQKKIEGARREENRDATRWWRLDGTDGSFPCISSREAVAVACKSWGLPTLFPFLPFSHRVSLSNAGPCDETSLASLVFSSLVRLYVFLLLVALHVIREEMDSDFFFVYLLPTTLLWAEYNFIIFSPTLPRPLSSFLFFLRVFVFLNLILALSALFFKVSFL